MENIAITGRESIRDRVANGLVGLMKPLYFLIRSRRKQWRVKHDDLAKYKPGTLGGDLYEFLEKNNFTLIPQAEFHDVYHVLFEYDTSMRDETRIQFVPLGNGAVSLPQLAATTVSLLFYPEHWGLYYRSFKRGRKAIRFYDWDFEKMLAYPTVEIRKSIFG